MFTYHYYILWGYVILAAVVAPIVSVFSWLVVARCLKNGRVSLRWLIPFAVSNTCGAVGALLTAAMLLLHVQSPLYYEVLSSVYLFSIFGMGLILYGIVVLWKMLREGSLLSGIAPMREAGPRVWPPPPQSP